MRIAGLGTVLVDHEVVLPAFPGADEKTEVLTDHLQVGGPVPTALVLLSRWGHECSFIGAWARDHRGRIIEDDLATEGVGFSCSQIHHQGRTGFAQVWVDERTGSRAVAAHRGDHRLQAGELADEALEGVEAIHLDGWCSEAALEAALLVKRNGGRVFLDTGSRKPGVEQLFPHVDLATCPLRSLESFTGMCDPFKGAKRFLDLGVAGVVITDGVHGSVFCDAERSPTLVPAFEVEVVDTTGAGDVFAGALLHASLNGNSLREGVRFASAAAALKCGQLGNREALPTLADVAALCAL